jgi:serine/threonine protein kinase
MGKLQALETARGVVFLHSRRVLHGDLRAARVLVSASGHALLSGYGAEALRTSRERERVAPGERPRPTRWMAPEVMRGIVLDECSEVYSLGMTLYEVMCSHYTLLCDC